MEILGKRGFTFLEVTGVLLLIGVLVLIAPSSFKGGLNKAEKMRIQSNIELVHTSVKVGLLSSEDYLKTQEKIQFSEVQKNVTNIYNKTGKKVKSISDGDYYKIREQYLENESLSGYFIFNSKKDEVFYLDIKEGGN